MAIRILGTAEMLEELPSLTYLFRLLPLYINSFAVQTFYFGPKKIDYSNLNSY